MTTASASDALALTASSFLREHLEHAQRACITSSFQAEDVVVLHMVLQLQPHIPVHLPRDRLPLPGNPRLSRSHRRRVESEPRQRRGRTITLPSRNRKFGILNQTAPDRCCGLRKVEPLFRALGSYTTWVTGLRREQSKSRANLQPHEFFTLPTGHILAKLSPLAEWTTRDVWQYAEQHSIPLLPLYEKGYTSIGCAPCTSLPFDANDPRSGRWSGRKLECGIHLQAH